MLPSLTTQVRATKKTYTEKPITKSLQEIAQEAVEAATANFLNYSFVEVSG